MIVSDIYQSLYARHCAKSALSLRAQNYYLLGKKTDVHLRLPKCDGARSGTHNYFNSKAHSHYYATSLVIKLTLISKFRSNKLTSHVT